MQLKPVGQQGRAREGGGALYAFSSEGSFAFVGSNQLSYNSAQLYGGAIYVAGTLGLFDNRFGVELVVEGTTFDRNIAHYWGGGAVHVEIGN